MSIRIRILFLAWLAVIIASCSCINWENVNGEEDPDPTWSPDDPETVLELAGTSFRTWHNAVHSDRSVALAMGTMADHLTCIWPNYAMRELALEPRTVSFNNSTSYEYYFIISDQWTNSYMANGDACYALRQLYQGMDFGSAGSNNKLVEAFSWFVSGVVHGYLGLVFDRAVVVKWDSDLSSMELNSWQEVIDESLLMLDRAIEIADANQFDVPEEWTAGQAMTNVELSQLANSYAARILACSSRTKEHNDALDWTKVLYYTRNGIDRDFSPYLGDLYGWYDKYYLFATYPGWGRVDHRIINLMDHDFPSRWPADNESWNTADGNFPDPATPGDNRLVTDYYWRIDSNFPTYLYYLWSKYCYKRYEDVFIPPGCEGHRPSFLAWEVKLLEAEALLRTGDASGALNILNDPAGPRKVRGGLPDILPEDDILRYILDEKEIECYLTGAGISYYDMRRTDRLQPGTLLHFPVPAEELSLMEVPHYTINAIADGIQGSAGGWTGYDEE